MKNPFSVGQKVKFSPKNRRNGEIVRIACDKCGSCGFKQYDSCTGDDKDRVWVKFYDAILQKYRVFSYAFQELEEESIPHLVEVPCRYDASPKDIKKLCEAEISVPSIYAEEIEEEDISASVSAYNKNSAGKSQKPLPAFWDKYVMSGMKFPI